MKELTEPQITFGDDRLKEFADKHNIKVETARNILLDIESVKDFYNWVNADIYLNCKNEESK